MAEQIGKLLTCDRCSRTVFLKYNGTEHLDGGFTKVDKFENKPDGWKHTCDLRMDLCPKCNEALHKFLEEFKEGRTDASKDS